MSELLPWLNLCLPPLLVYVVRIENRITRLEAQREADREARLSCLQGHKGVLRG